MVQKFKQFKVAELVFAELTKFSVEFTFLDGIAYLKMYEKS